MILEMVRLQALEYRNHIQLALRFLEQRKAWERREELASILPRDFAWFVRHFKLTDQAGHPIPVRSERSEEHTSELQSRGQLVCRLLLEKKKHPMHAASLKTHLAR